MYVRNILLAALLTSSLAACSSGSDIKESLGLNRRAPDEFRVYARPALTVPPEFSLRAPGTATDAPTGARADAQARNMVIGDNATVSPGDTAVPVVSARDLPTGSDANFLQKAGYANPKVRSSIQNEVENGLAANDSHYLINTSADGEPMVDAQKESDRLKQNKEEHKSPTAGDTPVIEPKSKGLLGSLGDLF